MGNFRSGLSSILSNPFALLKLIMEIAASSRIFSYRFVPALNNRSLNQQAILYVVELPRGSISRNYLSRAPFPLRGWPGLITLLKSIP